MAECRTPGESAVTVSAASVFADGTFTVALLQASLKALTAIHMNHHVRLLHWVSEMSIKLKLFLCLIKHHAMKT
jgi:hypothetical protein